MISWRRKVEKSNLGDRMKRYEVQGGSGTLLTRTPVIIRLDGKAFHTFTKGLQKPYDRELHQAMCTSMLYAATNMQGVKFGYTQSDEISILLTDTDRLTTEPWFGNKVQKMVSVAASMVTAKFNSIYKHPVHKEGKLAEFDARAFNVPFDEVANYFVWRQKDATRNSIQSLGQYHFSHKQLHGKSCSEIQDMLMCTLDTPVNWNDVSTWAKRGSCIRRKEFNPENRKLEIDFEIPIFTADRHYIEHTWEVHNDIDFTD
jgi:tRNA(His) guanylyltransferase